MKLKTLLKPLDPLIKITIQSENNGYVYAGDKSVCGGTEKNEAFCKELLERKVKSYTVINGNVAVVLRKENKWYFSDDKFFEDMGYRCLFANDVEGKLIKFKDGQNIANFDVYSIHKDWCVKR